MPRVGPKGQVVVGRETRERLGVHPGWTATELLVDGRVEVVFVPPPHRDSLKGILAPFIKRRSEGRSWRAIRKEAAAAAAWEWASRAWDDE